MNPVDAFADFVGDVPAREVALPWGDTRVWDAGAGEPVVLLHGIAASRRIFYRLVPLLTGPRRVVVPLLRGEDMPAPGADLADLKGDLGALLDTLDLADVTLYGVSFGGAIALAYAAGGDPRVRRVVAQGSFARFRLRARDRVARALSTVVPASLNARYFARRVRHGPETRLLAERAPGLDVLVPEWHARTPPATVRARLRLIERMDLSDEVRRIGVPLVFARGRHDKVVPRAFFEHLCALRADADRVEWNDAGHLAVLTHPEDVAALLL